MILRVKENFDRGEKGGKRDILQGCKGKIKAFGACIFSNQ